MDGHPLLEARALSVRFGDVMALDGVSAAFGAGELVGVIGPRGAGKTTFIDALSGALVPSAGELYAGGQRVPARTQRSPRRGVARTFQTPRLSGEKTVVAHVASGLQDADGGRHAARRLPDADGILRLIGLHAQARLSASALAPAQRRLLELGVALAAQPSVLMLDEAAADAEQIVVMARLVRRLRDEFALTVIWVEQAATLLLRHVERVLVFEHGRKIADGTPHEVWRHAQQPIHSEPPAGGIKPKETSA